MNTALFLLVIQGCLGAFDTLYFHEWKLRLPERPSAHFELRLHALRDALYAMLFAGLALFRFHGTYSLLILFVLIGEVVITLTDFIEEDRSRRLPPGERIGHAIMGMVYGAFLCAFLPVLMTWHSQPTELQRVPLSSGTVILILFAFGVAVSGIRDLLATFGVTPFQSRG